MLLDYQNTSFEVKDAQPDIAVLPIGFSQETHGTLPRHAVRHSSALGKTANGRLQKTDELADDIAPADSIRDPIAFDRERIQHVVGESLDSRPRTLRVNRLQKLLEDRRHRCSPHRNAEGWLTAVPPPTGAGTSRRSAAVPARSC